MKQITAKAIVLKRTNYAEADRIVTFLTPAGKLSAMVKGVRRSKSKLAGGIELFSISTITFMHTKGDLARILSTRLEKHFDGFIGDLPRMMFGYETMKLINRITEDDTESGFFDLLEQTLYGLNDTEIPLPGVEQWFYLRLLQLQGHVPNLQKDGSGNTLTSANRYGFDQGDMCFYANQQGAFTKEHIKLLRLCLQHGPQFLKRVKDGEELSKTNSALLKELILQQMN